MSQISPPIRILLVAVIGLCAAYMLFLRPKEEAVPAATPAAATTPVPAKDPNAQTSSKPGAAVQQAVRGADNASARADQAAGGAITETENGAAPGSSTGVAPVTGAAPGQTSAPGAPVTKEALKRLPKDVRGAVKNRKVFVMLFYNNRSYDDRAVRRELSKVDRFGGQVFVDAHWIKSVGRYQAITGGVDVDQSPTVVVADRNLKAETLVGYVDHQTIDQLVVDALRASGGSLLKSPYFRKIDSLCASTQAEIKALPVPATAAAVPAYLTGVQGLVNDMETKVGAIKPAKQHRTFHKRFKVYASDNATILLANVAYARNNPAKATQAVGFVASESKRLDKQFVDKNGAHGLSCF